MDDVRRITFEVDEASWAELESLAGDQRRSVAEIAAEATLDRLAWTRGYHAAIDEAQADFATGRVLSHEAFVARRAEARRTWMADRD